LTIWGLTKVADGKWNGWTLVNQYVAKNPVYPHGLDAIKEELKQLAIPYYKTKYWDAVRGDEINSQEIANKLADTDTNTGTVAIKLAQKVAGMPETGKIDDRLINYINNEA
ncbi:MAG TPA: glycosyl hydrolase 108 family protein, partial [Clostridia bacterium]